MAARMAGLATRLGSLPGLTGLSGPAKLLAVAPAANNKVNIFLLNLFTCSLNSYSYFYIVTLALFLSFLGFFFTCFTPSAFFAIFFSPIYFFFHLVFSLLLLFFQQFF